MHILVMVFSILQYSLGHIISELAGVHTMGHSFDPTCIVAILPLLLVLFCYQEIIE